MIRFLFKGLLRDRHRSLIPIIVTASGVMLIVTFQAWMTGIMGGSIEYNARFSTGHVKIMTREYAENAGQSPNDLAIIGTDTLQASLTKMFPDMNFVQRIYFAGLIDVPGPDRETRAQGPAMGIGVDILGQGSSEISSLNLQNSLKSGRLPAAPDEMLASELFAQKLGITEGDTVTLIGTSMNGEMTMHNFRLCGTVRFGVEALDRGSVITDISSVRQALDMDNCAGEILGFFNDGYYDDERANTAMTEFNKRYSREDDGFSLVMKSLKVQNNMGFMVDFSDKIKAVLISVFILAMSIVLWNSGLLGGLRRYGEFGMRLAIGEEKGHIYRTLILESVMTAIIGSVAGSIIGLSLAWYLQTYGVNLGDVMKNATIMMPTTFKAQITPATWYIGFIPGVISSLAGAMLSGLGIYKRQTAQLFKELE